MKAISETMSCEKVVKTEKKSENVTYSHVFLNELKTIRLIITLQEREYTAGMILVLHLFDVPEDFDPLKASLAKGDEIYLVCDKIKHVESRSGESTYTHYLIDDLHEVYQLNVTFDSREYPPNTFYEMTIDDAPIEVYDDNAMEDYE